MRRWLRPYMRPIVRYLMYFFYQTHYVDGDPAKVTIGERCGLANTLFNVSCGRIRVGDHSIFGYNVMVLTGRHRFLNGRRASLTDNDTEGWGGGESEVPSEGFDINIGSGCWLASGAIVSGGVTIGDNAIVLANAVVTHDVPPHGIVGGVPARLVGDTRELNTQTSTS